MLARSDHDFVLEERKPRRSSGKRGARRWTAVLATLFRNPGRTVVGAAAAAVGVGILVNALALQGGPHPAPFFKPPQPQMAAAPQAAAPLPPARPAEKAAAPAAPAASPPAQQDIAGASVPLPPRIQRQAAPPAQAGSAQVPATQVAAGPIPPAPIPNVPRDAIGDILKGGASAPAPALASAAEPDRSVLAVQRALNKLNYGPVKPDGLMGPGTRQAIERFERDRKLPVTGEASGRTARELAAASGIPAE
jgi:hypothetical protein